MLLNIILK